MSKRKKIGIGLLISASVYLIYFLFSLFYVINYELARTKETILTYNFTNFKFYNQFLISDWLLLSAIILLFISTVLIITDARKGLKKIIIDYFSKIKKRENLRFILQSVLESFLFIIQIVCSSLLLLLIIFWKHLYEKVNFVLLLSILLLLIIYSFFIRRLIINLKYLSTFRDSVHSTLLNRGL